MDPAVERAEQALQKAATLTANVAELKREVQASTRANKRTSRNVTKLRLLLVQHLENEAARVHVARAIATRWGGLVAIVLSLAVSLVAKQCDVPDPQGSSSKP